MAKDITNISQEARTRAYFNNTKFSNATLARRYDVSVRTIQRYRKNAKDESIKFVVPKSRTRLNKAIQRTGKKYARVEKEVSIKNRLVGKYDRLIIEGQRQADSVSGVAKKAKQREVASLREAKRIAKEQSLSEIVGMTGDLRTDDDWREWEANYNAVKGVLFA